MSSPDQKAQVSPEIPFEIIAFSRNDPDLERPVQELAQSSEILNDNLEFLGLIINHARNMMQIPELRGLLVEEHEAHGLRFIYVLDEFAPSGIAARDSVASNHADFSTKVGSGVNFQYGFCHGDFDGWVNRAVYGQTAVEANGNPFVGFSKSFDADYKPVAALKIV